jgi:hypothetical protein
MGECFCCCAPLGSRLRPRVASGCALLGTVAETASFKPDPDISRCQRRF